ERGVTAVVRQAHAAEPRRRHDVASEGARAAVVGLADEHEGDRPELLSGGHRRAKPAHHEDRRNDENAADVTDLHVFPPLLSRSRSLRGPPGALLALRV